MLNRQKTVLYLLKEAKRPVLRTELTKWCFLLRHQYPSMGGNAFFDFVPYKYGPFSFGLYQEIDKLVNQGYITQPSDKTWAISNLPIDGILPPEEVLQDARNIVQSRMSQNVDALISDVYQEFPEFTVNSEIEKLVTIPVAKPAIYTAGYEGISIDAFLNLLVQSGIKRLIDVRRNPIARRYGFHKSTLNRLTGNLGIQYVHVPELGIASELRQNLDSQNAYQKLFDKYEKTTLQSESDAIERVSELTMQTPSVLVCMEAEANCCHRSRLANKTAGINKLPIVHLKAA